jgi:hypothetical protein
VRTHEVSLSQNGLQCLPRLLPTIKTDNCKKGHHDHQKPIIYLIRHGEKPPKLPNGEDQDGLSAQGVDRAEALVNVFGKTSPYNIGYILAEHPKSGKYYLS